MGQGTKGSLGKGGEALGAKRSKGLQGGFGGTVRGSCYATTASTHCLRSGMRRLKTHGAELQMVAAQPLGAVSRVAANCVHGLQVPLSVTKPNHWVLGMI